MEATQAERASQQAATASLHPAQGSGATDLETLPKAEATVAASTPAAPDIWAIGGGKGGVGKSVIAANTAVALAQDGFRVALVDADLGGANLHTLLGMANPRCGLSDLITRRVDGLDEVMIPTPTPNLWLVSGARALLEMANPKFAQKEKILRHVGALPVDHAILDLGAGSAFNVLDFFLAARRGVLVVVPEHTSIENAYHFLKAAFFRKLKRAEPRERVRGAIKKVMQSGPQIASARELIARVDQLDPQAAQALRAEADSFAPVVLVNRIERADQQRLADDIGAACRDYFGTGITSLGCLENDRLLSRSVQERRPAAALYPECPFSRSIRRFARRLIASSKEAT